MSPFTRLAREWIAPALILILTLGMLIAGIFSEKRAPQSGTFHNFEVQDVVDGKTLSVRWLDNEEGIIHEGVSRLEISGIWSDKDKEPGAWYENRVEFFNHRVLQRVIRARTHLRVFVPPQPPPPSDSPDRGYNPPPQTQLPTKVFDVINQPSEVLLEDGTSLGEQTLEEGYGAFDFSDERLTEEDRSRYDDAEQRAKQKGLGIWFSQETAQTYSATRETYELGERLKKSGSIFYILTQLLLGVVTLALMYAARNDTPSFYAAAKLLILPAAMLMTELTRRTWIKQGPDEDSLLELLYVLYLVVAASIIGLGVKQFIVLVAYGPLKEWQTLWRISRARRALRYFVIALLCSILVYGLAYRFFGVRSLKTSAMLSLSQTYSLNLPIVIERTTALNTISVAQTVTIWVLLLVFGSLVPGLRDKPISLSIRSALALSIASLLTLTLAVASLFTNLFYYNIRLEGFNRFLDLHECFFLSLQLIIGKTYSDVYPVSGWMTIFQLLEVHLGLFLKLVALRFVFSAVRKAVDVKQASEDQVLGRVKS